MSDRNEKYSRPVRDVPRSGDTTRGGTRSARQYRNPYADRRPGRSDGEWHHDMHDPRDVPPSRTVRITNLHYEVTEAELKGLFSGIGPIESGPRIEFDRSGRSTGRATVTMVNSEDAEQAVSDFNGAKAKGQTIYVSFDTSRRPGRNGRDRSRSRSPGRRFNNGRGDGLASRLAGPDLGSRLSAREEDRRGMRDRFNDEGDGRGRRGRRDARGEEGGRGGRAAQGGRGGARAPRGNGRERHPAPTKDDLDAELDAFMKGPPVARESQAAPTEPEAVPASASADPAAAPPAQQAPVQPAAEAAAPAAEDVEMEL